MDQVGQFVYTIGERLSIHNLTNYTTDVWRLWQRFFVQHNFHNIKDFNDYTVGISSITYDIKVWKMGVYRGLMEASVNLHDSKHKYSFVILVYLALYKLNK